MRLDGESEFGSICCWTWDVFVCFLVVCGRVLFVFGDFGFEKHFGKIHYPLILLKGCLGFLLDRHFAKLVSERGCWEYMSLLPTPSPLSVGVFQKAGKKKLISGFLVVLGFSPAC